MKARQVGHRLTVCWATLGMIAVAWWEPTSLSYLLLHRAAGWAHGVSVAMVLMAVLGIADAVVNDILPERYVLPGVAQYRHLGYSVLGTLHLVYVYAMARASEVSWLTAQWLTLALACVWIACFDTYYHRQSSHSHG